MRPLIAAIALAASIASGSTLAQTTATAAKPAYSVSDTDIGTLLDDPAARAIVDKYIPGFSSGDQIDMARSMTLTSIQQYAPDRVTDKALADIAADLATLPAKK
jgi:para-nitrobenzyl esterase